LKVIEFHNYYHVAPLKLLWVEFQVIEG